MHAVYLCLSISTACLLQASYLSAYAYERPVHLATLSLLASAAGLYCILKWFPQLLSSTQLRRLDYELASHQDEPRDVTDKVITSYRKETLSRRGQVATNVLAAILLAIRIEIFRRIRANQECASQGFEAFIPFILSIYNARLQMPIEVKTEDRPDSSMYDDLRSNIWSFLLKRRWRYVPSAVAVGFGCYQLAGIQQGKTSTVVCSISSGSAANVPRLQLLSMTLDGLLAILADGLIVNGETSPGQPVLSCINILLGTAGIWLAIGAPFLLANIDNHMWILLLDTRRRIWILSSILSQAMLLTIFIFSTICLILIHGVLAVSFILSSSTTVVSAMYFIWTARQPYPAIGTWTTMSSFITVFSGLWLYQKTSCSVATQGKPGYSFNMAVPILLLFIAIWPELTKTSTVFFHPIDLLMYDARNQHDEYLQFANHSNNLEKAVALYKGRYQSNPPPGFDTWWSFAQERQSTITDDFDQIQVDLLPFRTVTPENLRLQTREIVSNPWNGISGISIRKGKASAQKTTSLAYESMIEGVVSMINVFAQHLPDMDLAFNLEDLPRVALNHKESVAMRDRSRQIKLDGVENWSLDRDADWNIGEQGTITNTVFEDWSLHNVFDNFGTIDCPASSASRRHHLNDFQPYVCTSCASPHSFGQFISNWSLAANPCHQPDLGQLYGAYMAPAVFKSTHKLRPVFSQSKMHGFSDILYPSSWNYMDMIAYSPTNKSSFGSQANSVQSYPDLAFDQKINSLYWRGTTSEGASVGTHVWRGMARQRLVHMANNLTNSYHDHVSVLLPDPNRARRYSYKVLSAAELLDLGLQTDMHLTDHIANCAGIDCNAQEEELEFVEPVNFQNHWKYRFLMDLDGPGTTGHMIPFMKSHSVPFKAGMLREWFDSRLTPWRHFVPQDLRLHGLWSTLAYFAGVDGSDGPHGQRPKWEPHLREAELIAEEGRDWANKVLRKEDMEIYMFRLLLEWARLTDDRRDQLGFTLT